jgi:hypothetical protein
MVPKLSSGDFEEEPRLKGYVNYSGPVTLNRFENVLAPDTYFYGSPGRG